VNLQAIEPVTITVTVLIAHGCVTELEPKSRPRALAQPGWLRCSRRNPETSGRPVKRLGLQEAGCRVAAKPGVSCAGQSWR